MAAPQLVDDFTPITPNPEQWLKKPRSMKRFQIAPSEADPVLTSGPNEAVIVQQTTLCESPLPVEKFERAAVGLRVVLHRSEPFTISGARLLTIYDVAGNSEVAASRVKLCVMAIGFDKPLTRSWRVFAGQCAIAAVAVMSFVAEEVWPNAHLTSTYCPNITITALGLLATVVFVERLLTWQRHQELAPVRRVAVGAVRMPVQALIGFMGRSYRAAAPEGSPVPSDGDELMRLWVREAPELNLRAVAPFHPPRTWAVEASETFVGAEVGLSELNGRYAEALGIDFIVASEELLQHPLWGFMKMAAVHEQSMTAAENKMALRTMRLMHLPSERLAVEEFVVLANNLFRAFDALSDQPLNFLGNTFDPDTYLPWGSGRFTPGSEFTEDPEPVYGLARDRPKHDVPDPG